MVQRLGQQGREQGRGFGGAGEQRAAVCAEGAAAGDAQLLGILQRPPCEAGAQVVAGGAGRALPVQAGEEGVGGDRGAGRELGEQVKDAPADLGGGRTVQAGAQGGEGAALGVPVADEAGGAGGGEPGGGQVGPAPLGGQPEPLVVGGGWGA
ncbi:hypothetical protein GCM10020000_33610 [Streptomyces olivoverticillatus]